MTSATNDRPYPVHSPILFLPSLLPDFSRKPFRSDRLVPLPFLFIIHSLSNTFPFCPFSLHHIFPFVSFLPSPVFPIRSLQPLCTIATTLVPRPFLVLFHPCHLSLLPFFRSLFLCTLFHSFAPTKHRRSAALPRP